MVQLILVDSSMLDLQLTFVPVFFFDVLVVLNEVQEEFLVELGVRLGARPVMHEIGRASKPARRTWLSTSLGETDLTLDVSQLPVLLLDLLYKVEAHCRLLFLSFLAQVLFLLEL